MSSEAGADSEVDHITIRPHRWILQPKTAVMLLVSILFTFWVWTLLTLWWIFYLARDVPHPWNCVLIPSLFFLLQYCLLRLLDRSLL